MSAWASRDLPGTGGQLWRGGEHGDCEELLSKQAAGAGDHLWIKVAKTDLSSQQCRAAVARAVGIPAEKVAMAGGRDRHGRCVQWFSIPSELVEYPQALKTAGYKGQVKVLEITSSRTPIDAKFIPRLRWRVRLRHAARDDGYRKGMAILDRLRSIGCPNYVAASRLGEGGSFAKWGKLLAQGRRLPGPVVAQGANRGQLLFAFQASLFNRYLATRVDDGLLASCIAGERMLTGHGGEELVDDDAARWQRRLESWEVTPLGPLFGAGMAEVTGEALAREAAVLQVAGVTAEEAATLRGARRATRFQPTKPGLDIQGEDLVLSCELPSDAYISVLVEELIKPEGHLE